VIGASIIFRLCRVLICEKSELFSLFGEAVLFSFRFGNFYHFILDNFVYFFAIFTLDFTLCFVVQLSCFQKFPNFTNYKKTKGEQKWKI